MQGEYKLLKITDRICHFARVTVEASPTENGIQITDTIIEPVDEASGEVSRKLHPTWIEAALRGARLSGEMIVQSGRLRGCCVVVRCVAGTVVDTTASDVTCAAALATWQALNPNLTLPSFDFVNGEWHINF